jgi:transmembrane sensor
MSQGTGAVDDDLEARAADILVRRRRPSWTMADQRALDSQLASDPALAQAYRRVQESWDAVGRFATSPELMALREQAISRARRYSARRWSLPGRRSRYGYGWAAAAAGALLIGAAIWQASPYGYHPGVYWTALGEQRTLELPDHSLLVLDARTRLRIRFSADARTVELLEGQAQFSVAKDPTRPFKVEAGAKTIVAVGTVFDVAYIDREIQVAMVEGRVAVLPTNHSDAESPAGADAGGGRVPSTLELSAGEGLQVSPDGHSAVLHDADLEAATAWRQGKVVFRNETLAGAVRRLNRYSRQQVVIDDPALASMRVNGVFDSGDAQGFAEAMQAYLSLAVDFSQGSTIHLRTKSQP